MAREQLRFQHLVVVVHVEPDLDAGLLLEIRHRVRRDVVEPGIHVHHPLFRGLCGGGVLRGGGSLSRRPAAARGQPQCQHQQGRRRNLHLVIVTSRSTPAAGVLRQDVGFWVHGQDPGILRPFSLDLFIDVVQDAHAACVPGFELGSGHDVRPGARHGLRRAVAPQIRACDRHRRGRSPPARPSRRAARRSALRSPTTAASRAPRSPLRIPTFASSCGCLPAPPGTVNSSRWAMAGLQAPFPTAP